MPHSLNRREFVKLSLAGAAALAGYGCAWRRPGLFASAPERERRAALRLAVSECVRHKDVPGAVALVQAGGRTVFHEAFGCACLTPGKPVPMSPAHRFDLASLTKVVATTTSLMILRDRGRLDLDDKLSMFLPPLAAAPDKKDLTIRQCLSHCTGLPPFKLYYKSLRGRDAYLNAIAAEPLDYKTGTKWVYSDLGFILLGLVVEAASGQPLDQFTQKNIFQPLGMKHTGYIPVMGGEGGASPRRFAATEQCPWRQRVMIGQVHDENAYAMGGVSGHAGLFSTAPDLARFGQMLLNRGELDGVQILSPESVALLSRPQIPAVNPNQALGWRLRASLESTIGFLGSPRAFGHTGFTGTSLWIDQEHQVVAVLLTNAVHPDRAKSHAAPVRLAFHRAIVERVERAPAGAVKTGLDVLVAEGFARLRGRRVALLTNNTAIDASGTHLVDLITKHPEVKVTAIFAPEHGFAGKAAAGEKVGDTAAGGIPVYSLYGARRRPDAKMAAQFDTLLYDIQDVGTRFYTYVWTLVNMMEFCAEAGKSLIVLDRPDPIDGVHVEGPVLQDAFSSTIGLKPVPTRYGMTIGELVTLVNQQGWLKDGRKAQFEVVKMDGWRRAMRFHETGLPWVAPSPNIPTWDSAAVFPGTCVFEGTQWSEGRGTEIPFEMVGGPGVDGKRLAKKLNALGLPGCRFLPVEFTPRSLPAAPQTKLIGTRCGGVFLRVEDHDAFPSVQAGLAVLIEMRAQALKGFEWRAAHFDLLLGNDTVRRQIVAGASLDEIVAPWPAGLAAFEPLRKKALLYA